MRIVLTPHRRANIQKLLDQLESLASRDNLNNPQSTKFQANYLRNVRDNRLAACKEEDGLPSPPDLNHEPSGLLFDPGSFNDLEKNYKGPIPVENFRKQRLDETLWEELQLRKDSRHDRKMMEFRQNLPTYNVQDDVMDTILQNQVVT